ncbi:Inorganic pyrophosphatase, putative, partial [Perkinsus marinus ATCC 50983]
MAVEIPRFTRAKMEISRESYNYPAVNPIKQDLFKDGSLREYPGAIYWNYGAAPQTFEDPNVEEEVGLYGDGDPLDLIEVGRPATQYHTGQIISVKILGALGLVDGGEADWKIIVIATDDPLFDRINAINDLESAYPNTISGIREWFRWYKYPT